MPGCRCSRGPAIDRLSPRTLWRSQFPRWATSRSRLLRDNSAAGSVSTRRYERIAIELSATAQSREVCPPSARNAPTLRVRLDGCIDLLSPTRREFDFADISCDQGAPIIHWRGLPRLKDSKVVCVADEDAPEDPQRQESIVSGRSGESFRGVCVCKKRHPGKFKGADLQDLKRYGPH